MMKISSTFKVLYILALFFCINSTFATPGEGDPVEDSEDAPLEANGAPIDDYLIPMLIIGTATAFVLLRRRKVQNV